MESLICWCGNPQRQTCCAPLLDGHSTAATPEALMRARYSAYVNLNRPYLLASWHPDTRPPDIQFNPNQRWLGLKVKDTLQIDGNHGEVEFVARYKIHGRGHRLHERSRFRRIRGQWFYLDGDLLLEK